MKKKFKYITLSIYLVFFSVQNLHSRESNPKPGSEFEIFDNTFEENNAKNSAHIGLQIDLVIRNQYSRDSIFIPNQNFAALDSWIIAQYFRFSKQVEISKFFVINLDMGFGNTTKNRRQILNTINDYGGASNVLNAVNPGFNQELSFFHFYAYELALNFNFSPTDVDDFFLKTGILPVKLGNNFYKNPVSFFERYLPPREYIQEYTPLSFPGIKLNYIHEIYNIELLYIPDIPYQDIGKNGEGKDISQYLYFVNSSNILMMKNNFDFSRVQVDLYFFWENQPEAEIKNHFGFGPEINWRIFKNLNVDWQFLESNGKTLYGISENNYNNSVFYSFEPLKNSTQEFRLESLISFVFSGIKDYEVSLGYYYNGFGFSKNQYDSLTNSLIAAKKGYNSNDTILKSLHLLYFASVLGQYDLFALDRHYLFLNILNLQNTDFLTWGLSAFVSLVLPSVMPVLFIHININTNIKFYFQLLGNIGVHNSIFGESPLAGSVNGGLQLNF